MKINTKILSIPPYISTAWKNIASLHVENQEGGFTLAITLLSGAKIEVPGLEPQVIEVIFAAHSQVLDLEEKTPQPKTQPKLPFNFIHEQEQTLALQFPGKVFLSNIDHLSSLAQHNPEQADMPDMPEDLLLKITHLAKTIGLEDPNGVQKPEPHCNCMHCQIARAIHRAVDDAKDPTNEHGAEEIVSDEDLKFKTWDISQTGEKLFHVSNPLDTKEHFSVYLGDPVGCTCGEKHCEHVRSVLNS